MYDVDLFILKEDLLQAELVLQRLGYQLHNAEMGWNLFFAREFMNQVPYHKGAMVVELHSHIVSNNWFRFTTAFDLAGLWSRAILTQIAGVSALRLCPEDELIHLCYHTAVHHGLAHPYGVRDILGVLHVERENLDWAVLANRARAWRVSVAVWAALSVARSKMQEARSKRQESRIEKPATSNVHHASRITHHEAELIPESALEALRVPPWRQRLLHPFVRRAVEGQAALVSGTMRFLGVLLVDRLRDLPGVVLRGLFPGQRWLQLRYDLTPRQASRRQFTYPLEVLARGIGALLKSVIRYS